MGSAVMTSIVLWAAFSAAYLVYCIIGGSMIDQELPPVTYLKPQAGPDTWRRHLLQVEYHNHLDTIFYCLKSRSLALALSALMSLHECVHKSG